MDAVPITKKLIAFGSKKIYLPKFTIALVRTSHLSPYHARFLVPLDFSKYDLRDYLYHAYNVKCFNIRSYVKQMPVRDTQEQRRHWFRPESKKYMTVEMEKAFVWPEEPENMEPWGREHKERARLNHLKNSGQYESQAEGRREAMRALRDQAKAVLNKKVAESELGEEIASKKAAGQELSEAERERVAELQQKEEIVQSMSRLEVWQKARTGKVVQSEDASKFAIKA